MPESDILPRGLIIADRFKLGALRARGGMASVYEGVEKATDRHVAIKFLRSELAKVPEIAQQFIAEAQVLQKLDHPNVVRALETGAFGGARFIVMEFVSGPTLRERLRWGRPEKDEILSILRQAAAGLDHAHDRGVIHRDVKPDNLILDKNVVRIADFGIAMVSKGLPPTTGDSESRGGTVIYSAPEQFQPGSEIDRRTDVYSLGIVAYEMFTGRVPFASYKPASTLNHQVSPAADAILERSWHHDPYDRFPSAGAFVEELEAALKLTGAAPAAGPLLDLKTPPGPMKAAEMTPSAVIPAQPPKPSLLPWFAVLSVFILALAVATAWLLGWGPFGSSGSAVDGPARRVRASQERAPHDPPAPRAVAELPRAEPEPPAPAGLLVDRLTVGFKGSASDGSFGVDVVELEARVQRDCENAWEGQVHLFVEGDAFGDRLSFRAENADGTPRIKAARVDFDGADPKRPPKRVQVFLERPDAQLELDFASGSAVLVRKGGAEQRGAFTFQP